GPWKLVSFSKSQEVLEANTSYWDASRIPKVSKVTFLPLTETNKEVQGLKNGTVSAVYPQPAPENVPQLKTGGHGETSVGVTAPNEARWSNEKAGKPFADKNLRDAFSHAFDRTLFLNDIVKPFYPPVTPLNCALWTPGLASWCTDADAPFKDITHDSAKVA